MPDRVMKRLRKSVSAYDGAGMPMPAIVARQWVSKCLGSLNTNGGGVRLSLNHDDVLETAPGARPFISLLGHHREMFSAAQMKKTNSSTGSSRRGAGRLGSEPAPVRRSSRRHYDIRVRKADGRAPGRQRALKHWRRTRRRRSSTWPGRGDRDSAGPWRAKSLCRVWRLRFLLEKRTSFAAPPDVGPVRRRRGTNEPLLDLASAAGNADTNLGKRGSRGPGRWRWGARCASADWGHLRPTPLSASLGCFGSGIGGPRRRAVRDRCRGGSCMWRKHRVSARCRVLHCGWAPRREPNVEYEAVGITRSRPREPDYRGRSPRSNKLILRLQMRADLCFSTLFAERLGHERRRRWAPAGGGLFPSHHSRQHAMQCVPPDPLGPIPSHSSG